MDFTTLGECEAKATCIKYMRDGVTQPILE